ncbi:MAG: FliA/WhiG family RNA polymerase sigma factor [Deltaproteobacteria bacterium]|nr:FliA/WhiG family RNA polymerase sigma factor [Deltaproteobacteria bacterium]
MSPSKNSGSYNLARDLPQPDRVSWRNLTEGERAEYIKKYAPLIRYIADRLAVRLPNHVSREDLISSGTLGLIDAIDKFDPDRKIMFKTYAEFRIKGAMLDELRSMDWVPRSIRRKANLLEKAYHDLETLHGRPATDEETAEVLGLNLDKFHRLLDEVKSISILDIDSFYNPLPERGRDNLLELLMDGDSGPDPLTLLNLNEARSIVAQTIDKLPEKENLVVSMYYYDELTMKEIGAVLGYTESRISQLHTKAILRLRVRLRFYFEHQTG